MISSYKALNCPYRLSTRLSYGRALLLSLALFACTFFGVGCDDPPPALTINIEEHETAVLAHPLELKVSVSEAPASVDWRVLSQPLGEPSELIIKDLDPRNPLESQATLIPKYLGAYAIVVKAQKGDRSVETLIELEVNCSPPLWQVTLQESQSEQIAQVGQSIAIEAVLMPTQSDACPEIPALGYDIDWSLRSWPGELAATAPAESLAILSPTRVRLLPQAQGRYLVHAQLKDALNRVSEADLELTVSCGQTPPTLEVSFVGEETLMPSTETSSDLDGGSVTIGQPVLLQAQGSDPDQSCLSDAEVGLAYRWEWVQRPAGSQASLSSRVQGQADFTADVSGVYILKAQVTDHDGLSQEKTIRFEASTCFTRAPTIELLTANPALLDLGQSTRLAIEWNDPDVNEACNSNIDDYRIEWRILNAPAQSIAQIRPSNEFSPSFTPDLVGSYQLSATVYDPEGLSTEASLELEVTACQQAPLQLTAGSSADQVNLYSPVTLSASAQLILPTQGCTEDLNLNPAIQYHWQTLTLPPGASPLPRDQGQSITWLAEIPGTYVFEVYASDDRGLQSARQQLTVQVNECGGQAPQINAISHEGALAINNEIRLSAQVSDPDQACGMDNILDYHWSVASRPVESQSTFSEQAQNQERPTFNLDRSGEYQIQLQIVDQSGRTAEESYTLTVSDCGEGIPSLLTSVSQQPQLGQWISLTTTVTDPDSAEGCNLPSDFTYTWTTEALPLGYERPMQLNGSQANVFIERPGTYRFSVYVDDDTGLRSNVERIEFEIEDCGASAPVIDAVSATPNQAQIGQAVRFQATVNDPDAACGQDLSSTAQLYWQLLSKPRGSLSVLSAQQTPTLIPDQSGEYRVQVFAQTADGLISETQEVSVTVNGCGAFEPSVVTRLSSASVRLGEEVSFGVDSTDLDREAPCNLSDPHEYQWRILGRPVGSQAQVSNAQATEASLMPDLVGRYELELIVTDSRGLQTRERLEFVVEACGQNQPILSQISLDRNDILLGEQVQLSGIATPPDLTCVTDQNLQWQWQVISRPVGSTAQLSSAQTEQVSFMADQAGTYRFSAQVLSVHQQPSQVLTTELNVQECGTQVPVITELSSPPQPQTGFTIGEPISFTLSVENPNQGCSDNNHLSSEWRFTQVPVGSQAVINSNARFSGEFIPDLNGVYQVSGRVYDAQLNLWSDTQTVEFIIASCGGEDLNALIAVTAPTSEAPQTSVNIDTYTCENTPFVQLDASQSTDPNLETCGVGGDFSYQWRVQEVSAGLSVSVFESNREAVNIAVDGLAVNQRGTTRLEVEVENNLGLSDIAEATINTTRLASPQTLSATPNFFCVGERTITLGGVDFFRVGTELPIVFFGQIELPASNVSNCTQVDQSNIFRCTQLDVVVPNGLESDLYSISVKNPYPIACTDEQAGPTVLLISAPRIEETAPTPICRGQFSGEITLSGSGFLQEQNGASASIDVNNINITNPSFENCIDAGNQLLSCDTARFDLPQSQKDIKDLNITVTNPATSGCAPEDLRASILLSQSEPPIIDDVTPRKICYQGGTLSLIGNHFEPNMTVDLGPYRADQVVNTNGLLGADAIWQQQAQPRFVPGEYILSARNASGCEESFSEPILVTEGPVPFFVDPPVVYSGISLQATAYLGNLFGGSVSKAEIQSGNNPPIELEFSDDPDKPSLIKLVLPAGLPDGLYDLTLYDDVDCPGTTPALLRVTSDLSVNILEIDPPFAWTNSSTSVTVLADVNAGFVPTPRSYLSPSVANECAADNECSNQLCRQGRCVDFCQETSDCVQGSACVSGACLAQAAELRAASLNSVEELKGVVAQGFSTGNYDLVVVNPDGSVGLLEQAVKVNALPPPKVSAVSPGSWETNNPALPIQISGDYFRDVTLRIECFDNGASSFINANLVSQNTNLISLTIDTSTLSSTSICSVRVTNSDAAYADFAPLTATNPSGNFVDFNLGPALPANEARRLSAVTYAKVPNGQPYLYVFGGDQGSNQTALNDNLSIGINALGELQTWQKLPTTLPERLTHIEAHTVDRFIYIMGGFSADTNQATDQIIRAEILDPLYVPTIDQVDFEFDPNIQGLDSGIYYYRVSAVYDANDLNNPNGESLPSEPQPVFIPNIPIGVRLKLTWLGLNDAIAYRIYRSPTPNLLFGVEELVAEVPANQLEWFDAGVQPLSNKRTLNIGELGNWQTVGQLNSTRYQHGTTLAVDPNNSSLYHLYAVGGFADGVLSDGYEVLSIDISQERQHVLSPIREQNSALGAARSQLKVSKATPQEASGLPAGKAFIYALGGAESDRVEVAEVLAGGLLGTFNRTEDMQRSRQGYYATIANNNLLSICGQNGAASSTAEKGELCGVNGGGRNCGRPEYISKWSSLGGTGAQACVNPGGAAARGFLYLIGGGDANGPISNKVDISLLGGTP